MCSTRGAALIFVALCWASAASVAARENWPQWRGPASQGVSAETQLATEWAPDKNIVWRTELPGQGHSSPVVWGDRIFLTTAIEGEVVPDAKAVPHTLGGKEFVHPDSVGADRKHTLRVLALETRTGKIVWEQTAYEGTVHDARHRRSSFAAPTAATDGAMVYAYFGPEGLYAFDVNGKPVWKAVEKFRTLGLGTGTSPVLYRDLVIVVRDEDEGQNSAVVAYDKKTGRQVWRTTRPVQISWATPVIVEAGGRTELVTNGTEFVIAYDPDSGKELWRSKGVESNAIHTPLVGHGLVIVTAGFPAKKVIALRPGNVPDDQRVAWEYAKGTAYVTSNILYGDHLYLVTDNGIITVLDAKTGAIRQEGVRPPVPAHFMGSPVAFGGFIALTSEEGDTFLLKAGSSPEVIRTNKLDEPVYTSPAIANGRIYIRGQKHLVAIGTS